MTQEIITSVVRLIPDEGAAQQSAAAVQRVADQVANLNADFNKLGPVARAGALDIEQRFDDLDRGINEHRANVKALADEYDNLGSSATSAAQTTSAAQSSGGGFNLRQSISQAGGLASTVGGGQAVSAVSSVLALTETFGPFGLAVGLGTALLKAETDADAKRTEQAKGFISAVEGTAGQTTESLNKQIQAEQQKNQVLLDSQKAIEDFKARLQTQKDAYVQNISSTDEYENNLRNINAELYDFTGGALGVKDGVGTAVTAVGQFSNVLTESQTEINKSNGKIAFLNTQLNSQTTATADAAEAAAKLAKTQEAAVNLAIQVDGLTKAQRDERAAQDQREIALINERIQSGELGNQATYDLSVKQQQLYEDYQAVTSVSDTYADQLEREKNAIQAATDANQSYLDVLASEGKTRDAITAQQAKIDQLNTDAATKETDLLTQKNTKIVDIEAQAGEDRAKIAQDSADAIAKIERDAGREQFADKANRDAVAFTQSLIKQKDAEDDQKKADAKALATLNTNLDKQEKAVDVSYKQQVQQVETSLRSQVATQRQGLLQLQTDLLNEKNSELALSKQFGIGIVSQHEYMLQGIESAVLSYGVRIVSGLNNIFNSYQPLPAPQQQSSSSQGTTYTRAQIDSIVHQNLSNLIGLRQG